MPAVTGSDLRAIPVWYVRSTPLPLPFLPLQDDPGPVDVHRLRRAYAAGRERRSLAASFVVSLERSGAVLVNPPSAHAQHFLKLEQLQRLREAGVPVPRTLATNDPVAVREFAESVWPMVYKPLAGGALCRRMTQEDLQDARLNRLAAAPVMFQEEIPGCNIRVYVVGGAVVSSYEIVSGDLDYRGSETSVQLVKLGGPEQTASVRAAAACGMDFTGIDIRRRPDGSFALLECNPSPMFANIERRTGGMPVTRALADFLLGIPPAAG